MALESVPCVRSRNAHGIKSRVEANVPEPLARPLIFEPICGSATHRSTAGSSLDAQVSSPNVPGFVQTSSVPDTGFRLYAWQDTPEGKQPYHFARRDGQVLTFAGIQDAWINLANVNRHARAQWSSRSPTNS